ncbi:MAG TPA: FliM/FliN family flagellar motor switch protein [Candidatus Acidoferrum sp.]|jgi:flagellar motor switch protein FliM
MRKVLSQEEIDALFSTAQPGQKTGATAVPKNVEKCNLGESKVLSAEQGRAVNMLHELFSRQLSDSLGTYLRTDCEIGLVAGEQLRYSEFLGRVPELSYLASLRMLPIDAGALVLMDLAIVFPVVDLALGGSGRDVTEIRQPTEIEGQIIEPVISLIARELQSAWASVVAFDIQFDQRQPLGQAHSLMGPNERILSLNFEIRLIDLRGALNIALPAVVANALLRKLEAPGSLGERTPSRNARQRIRECLLDCSFLADLSLPLNALSVRELLNIQPEYVLVLPHRADKPVHLNIAGKPVFEAYPVRTGAHKGARVEKRLRLDQLQTKE